MTALSAVIPTRDRPDLLRDCLATLVRQEVPAGTLEVIVVDDGSTADLAGVTREFAGAAVPVRYERQEPSGLNPGRNRGAAAARAPVVAYLDDDTLVAPGWAAAVLDAFGSTGCDAVAGRIELRLEGAEPPWLSPPLRRYLSELELGDTPRWIGTGDELPFGANCAVTAAALARLGGFRAGLDREGASLVSNGEFELFRRLVAGGGRITYWPAAHVQHRVPAERLTLDWFRRRAHAQGVSDVRLDRMSGATSPLGTMRDVLRTARAAPILVKGLLRGTGTVHAELWVAYCRGRLAAAR